MSSEGKGMLTVTSYVSSLLLKEYEDDKGDGFTLIIEPVRCHTKTLNFVGICSFAVVFYLIPTKVY